LTFYLFIYSFIFSNFSVFFRKETALRKGNLQKVRKHGKSRR